MRPFADALKSLNSEVSSLLVRGRKSYIKREDLISIFQKQKGRCNVCGLELQGKGRHQLSANFCFRVPIKLGGSITPSNLILVCPLHKKEFSKINSELLDRTFGYNAFSDLIVQLVNATLEKDDSKVLYFKVCVDNALTEFVNTLRYNPISKPSELESISLNKNISSLVEDITKVLESKFKEINLTKEYKVIREG